MKKINKFGVITCPSTYIGCNNITTFFFLNPSLSTILAVGIYSLVYVYIPEQVELFNFALVLPLVLSLVPTILFMLMPGCSCCGGCGCCNIHNDVHMYDAGTGLVIRQDDQDANNDDDIEMAEQ